MSKPPAATGIDRRRFLGTSAAALAHLGLSGRAVAAERPNVLLITVEDASPHRFGAYGNTDVQTPTIDRFLGGAMRFDRAHCTVPVCGGSRAAMLTGLRPATTGVYGNTMDWAVEVPNATTIPMHFRDNGYHTANAGKISHPSFRHNDHWSETLKTWRGIEPSGKKQRMLRDALGVMVDPTAKHDAKGSPFLWGPSGLDTLDEPDGRIAEHAVRFLRRKHSSPFLLAVGFHRPHLPLTAPDVWFSLYDPDKLTVPPRDTKRPPVLPNSNYWEDRRFDEAARRSALAACYACLTFVDAQIKRLLDTLDESGLADNTIVVLWTDHGFLFGEHNLWRKGCFYAQSSRVLLGIRAPGMPAGICSRPVESIDVFPTLVDLAGLPQPKGLEAKSMRPLLVDPKADHKPAAFVYRMDRATSVVGERYVLNHFPTDPKHDQLFDHETDPGEMNNRAGERSLKDVEAQLRAWLAEGKPT